MIRAFLLALLVVSLTGCVAPGLKYYAKVESVDPKTGAVSQKTKPILVVGSDIVGDQEISIAASGAITHRITTPRAADGSIAVQREAILNKDRTAVIGYNERPLVAAVHTSSVWEALGNFARKNWSGVNNFFGTIGTSLVGWETAKQAGAATQAAVEVVRP